MKGLISEGDQDLKGGEVMAETLITRVDSQNKKEWYDINSFLIQFLMIKYSILTFFPYFFYYFFVKRIWV